MDKCLVFSEKILEPEAIASSLSSMTPKPEPMIPEQYSMISELDPMTPQPGSMTSEADSIKIPSLSSVSRITLSE